MPWILAGLRSQYPSRRSAGAHTQRCPVSHSLLCWCLRRQIAACIEFWGLHILPSAMCASSRALVRTLCCCLTVCLGSGVCPAQAPFSQQLGRRFLADLPSVLCLPSALLGSSPF